MSSRASLNHIFRSIWNHALGAMVAVAEVGSGRGKTHSTGLALPQASAFFPLKTLLALICIGFAAINTVAHANPTGGVAVVGQMATTAQGNHLQVSTQNGAGLNHSAINWQTFSVGAGQSTHFQQPNASSTVINRVVTNTPTQIFGNLSSNGHLVLVNQAGIAVGAGAVVDTAGFIASTLPMSDADTLLGRLRFGGSGGAVQVSGQVLARSGDAVLIGQQVQTGEQALIQAPNGSTVLAAGQQVEITGRGLEGIHMTVQAPSDQAVNLGKLQGDAVAIFAGTLKHSGAIQATRATLEGGKVVLKAAGDAVVAGQGSITASGTRGGSVDVLGQRVGLADQARIDARGTQGGGSVRIGGDYQGKNAEVPNAQITYLGQNTHIEASATEQGDGGRVIVWADDITRAHGRIDAKGGAKGGDGGFVETSGKRVLDASATVDASAPKGKAGTWLLDPYNITIDTGADSNVSAGPNFNATDNPAVVNVGSVTTALNGGTDVNVYTGHGAITVNAPVAWTTSSTLTLDATDEIALLQGITGTNGTLVLTNHGGGAITNNDGMSLIKVDKLAVNGDSVSLTGLNEVNAFSGHANFNLTFHNTSSGGLTVDNVAGIDGISTNYGNVSIVQSGSGAIYVNKDISSGYMGMGDITLISGSGGIMGPGVLSAGGLRVSSAGTVSLTGNNQINTIAGTAAGSGLELVNSLNLEVGSVGGADGISVSLGNVALTLNVVDKQLTVNKSVQAPLGNVRYTADNLHHYSTTTTSGDPDKYVEIKPFSTGTLMEFCSLADEAGKLRLSSTELTFSTPMLKFGLETNTAGIVFNETVSSPSFSTLSLITGGSITQSAGSTLTINKLNADGRAGVTMTQSNAVASLGGRSDTGAFTFTNARAAGLMVDFVDVNDGILVGNGNAITLNSTFGLVKQSGSSKLQTTGKLEIFANGGIAMGGTNSAREVNLMNTGSGDIEYHSNVGAANTLRIAADNQADGATLFVGEATGNIEISASLGSLRTKGGDILVTTLGTDKSLNVGALATVDSTNGGGSGHITLMAGAMSLSGGFIKAGSNTVTLTRNLPNVEIAVGGTSGTGVLGIKQADIDAVNAVTLRIGDTTEAGDVHIVSSVQRAGDMGLLSKNVVRQDDGAYIDVGSYGLHAFGKQVILNKATNRVGVLAGTATDADFGFYGAGSYAVGSTGEMDGVHSLKNVTLYASGQLTLDKQIAASETTKLVASSVVDGNSSENNVLGNALDLHVFQGGSSELDTYVSSLALKTRSSHYGSFAPAAGTMAAGDIKLRVGASQYDVPGLTLAGTDKQRGDQLAQAINSLYLSTGVSAFADMDGKVILVGANNSGFDVLNGGSGFSNSGLAAATYAPGNTGVIEIRNSNLGGINIVGIDSARSVNIESMGVVSQTGAIKISDSSALLAAKSYGNIYLIDSGNEFFKINLENRGVSGDIDVKVAASALQINSAINHATSGDGVRIVNTLGDVNLRAPVVSGNGGDIIIATGAKFTNSHGAGAFQPGSGARWLVYSNDPDLDDFAGVAPNFRHYNVLFDGSAYTGPGTGNGVIYGHSASLGIGLTSPITKIYDGNATASICDPCAYTVSGLHLTETATFSTVSANFNEKTVAGANTVTANISPITIKDGAIDVFGYTAPVSVIGTGAITKKPLTASYTATNKTYDGNTSASVVADSSDIVPGDKVSGQGIANFSDKNVGVGKTVTISGIILSGDDAGNYSLTNTSAFTTANITPKTLTVGFTAANKVYDGNVVASVLPSSSDILGNDDVSVSLSEAPTFSDRNVGSGKAVAVNGFFLSGADAGNYSLASSRATTTAAISRAESVAWVGGSSGNWSDAAKWAGGALPDAANVAEVIIPAGSSVNYDMTSATSVERISSNGSLSISGAGVLTVGDYLKTGHYTQSAGTVQGSGAAFAEVSTGFSKLGGNLSMPARIALHQSVGDLVVSGGVQAPKMSLQAPNGQVNVNVSNIGASTSIELLSVVAGAGSVSITNTGGVVTTGEIKSVGGDVWVQAHSPITIGTAGVSATGSISLLAQTADSSSNVTLNGPLKAVGGGVTIAAHNNVVQNSAISASTNVAVSAGVGAIILGSTATTDAPVVTYSAAGRAVAAPVSTNTSSTSNTAQSTQAGNIVNTFLEKFEAAVQEEEQDAAQTVASNDGKDEKKKKKEEGEETRITEGEVCLP